MNYHKYVEFNGLYFVQKICHYGSKIILGAIIINGNGYLKLLIISLNFYHFYHCAYFFLKLFILRFYFGIWYVQIM